MTPTANILKLFFQTLPARRQSTWTARQLSAAIDKCERSVVTAIRQLAKAGEITLDDDGSVILPTSCSFPDEAVESEECCVYDALTPADDQLSLFDDCDDVPASPVQPTTEQRTSMSLANATPVQAAAVCLRPPKPASATNQKTKKPADDEPCTNFVQGLHKTCTSPEQDDRLASLQATMAAFSATFDERVCAHDAHANPMNNQENKLINSMGYVSPMDKTYEAPSPPPKKRDEALYDYYLAIVKQRFPEWHVKIYNPVTSREGNCKWAVETLAAMMAWGMPESVFWDTVEYCFGSNKNTSAKSPALALLHIVKELKSQYRWKADWQED